MAVRQKKNKKPGRGGRLALWGFAALMLVMVAITGICALNAGIVRIRRADVVLQDLPPAFEGVSLLYISDIDLCGLNSPRKSGALFHSLQSLKPDVVLLGGDYTSPTLLEVLNRSDKDGAYTARALEDRTSFFHYIMSFHAPLGSYAIASPDDPDWADLADRMAEAGIKPLFNDRAALTIGSEAIWLTGICEESTRLNSAGSAFQRDDCVISVAYGPEVLPILLTSEASDGGQWNDLLLCGHTHGGQVRLFGRSALTLTEWEQRYSAGWYHENGLPILVNQGLGCEGANLRLGSTPEVWLITLRRP